MGGVGTGNSFMNNVQALAGYQLNLRTFHSKDAPDIRLNLFGKTLDMPILAAPVAGTPLNMNNAVPEEYLAEAMLGGAVAAGSLGMAGDGPNPAQGQAWLAALKRLDGRAAFISKPRRPEDILRLLRQAEDAGAWAVGVDVDAAGIINMVRAGQYVGPKPIEVWKEIIAQVKAPFILKGIMTPDEAEMAVGTGAAAIVVSNHGGRILDHTPGTADVLPYIADKVKGKITILVDGGVRSGYDALKMLALGADAVLVGRPLSIAAVGGGAEAVAWQMAQYADQLRSAMILTGCGSLAEITPDVLWGECGCSCD
jgi:isopentenyl diphosphate isomerase/L-lactate dehydrogenase-like FMN-dependent dehydrogenase